MEAVSSVVDADALPTSVHPADALKLLFLVERRKRLALEMERINAMQKVASEELRDAELEHTVVLATIRSKYRMTEGDDIHYDTTADSYQIVRK